MSENRVESNQDVSRRTVGVKHDADKVSPTALLRIADAIECVARVLIYGAKKYGVNNWIDVPNAERRYYDAALRHMFADAAGDDADPESGEPHMAHAACCLLFISDLQIAKSMSERCARDGASGAWDRPRPYTKLDHEISGVSLLPPLAIMDLARALDVVDDFEIEPRHRALAIQRIWESARDRAILRNGIRDSTMAALWTLSALEDRIREDRMRLTATPVDND